MEGNHPSGGSGRIVEGRRFHLGDAEVDYTWYRSARRRRLTLMVTREGGVEVHSPVACTVRQVEAWLGRNSVWLQNRLAHQKALGHSPPRLGDGTPLPWLDERLELQVVDGSPVRVELRSGRLLVTTPDRSPGQLALILEAWYRRMAGGVLRERLDRLAVPLGLPRQAMTIRGQKTRWGSCSSRSGISLNWRLLLLPSAVVDYVLTHELCHCRHPNHSDAFWVLVSSHCPGYRALRARLRGFRMPW